MKNTRKDISRKNRNIKQGVNKKKQNLMNQVSIEYYEKKIVYLSSRALHPRLVMLACSDAPPIRPENISSQRGLKRHAKNASNIIKKLADLKRQQKKILKHNISTIFLGAA